MPWDLFAQVVDNHGDVGFSWRLAADLAGRGETVRLWLDDRSALSWMAPRGVPGVSLGSWRDAVAAGPAEVVIETFGCGLPDGYALQMAHRTPAPVWIDVEYLSAEAYVERSHGLPSPRTLSDGSVLTQWYFYPGFTSSTGGLVREPGLLARRDRFERAPWLADRLGLAAVPMPQERVVSLFCYDNPKLPNLLDTLAATPTLLLVTRGAATHQVERLLGAGRRRGALRALMLPLLDQPDYDRLLWASDLNLVRGEDSFVRAQWAGAPFLWQIYPQADHAHVRKLDAFLDLHLQTAQPGLQSGVRAAFRAWNSMGAWHDLPAQDAWRELCRDWRDRLAAGCDLAALLQAFARARTL